MPKDKDNKQTPGEEFSLDAILAEFGSGAEAPTPPPDQGATHPLPTKTHNLLYGQHRRLIAFSRRLVR